MKNHTPKVRAQRNGQAKSTLAAPSTARLALTPAGKAVIADLRFALGITGDSMLPAMRNGYTLIFAPMDADGCIAVNSDGCVIDGGFVIPDGSVVYASFAPSAKEKGCIVARWHRSRGKIQLKRDNKKFKSITCEPTDLVEIAAMVRGYPLPGYYKPKNDGVCRGTYHPGLEGGSGRITPPAARSSIGNTSNAAA